MELLLIYMVVGLLAGFVGGLFGVGGGVVIVPLLLLSFSAQGVDPAVSTHMAIGTSLAVIVFISINSALAHHRRGAVTWHVFKKLTPGIIVGSVVGSLFALRISGPSLQVAFGAMLMILGLQAGFGFKPSASRSIPGSGVMFSVGVGIGGLSSMFGIGGGSLTTPFLLYRSVSIKQAIGTSAACGLPIGLFSSITYSLGGDTVLMPEWSIGYVYLPALLGVAVFSVISVRLGAALAHYFSEPVMKRLFALLSVTLGVRFVLINL
jgi:uncharacterized membrane protein YfcA